jgi:hypothetical protein
VFKILGEILDHFLFPPLPEPPIEHVEYSEEDDNTCFCDECEIKREKEREAWRQEQNAKDLEDANDCL